MQNNQEVLLKVENLCQYFGPVKAVDDVSFNIYKGETFGLVGESGSGKTTIGRAVMRILPTCGGDIIYDGDKINGKIPKALDKKVIKEVPNCQ